MRRSRDGLLACLALVLAACGSAEQGAPPSDRASSASSPAPASLPPAAAENTDPSREATSPSTTFPTTIAPPASLAPAPDTTPQDPELTTANGPVQLPEALAGFEIFEGPTKRSGIPGLQLEYVLYVDFERSLSYSIGVLSGVEVERALARPEQYEYQAVAGVTIDGQQMLGRNLDEPSPGAPTELVWPISGSEAMTITSGTLDAEQLESLARTMETQR